MTRQFAVSFDYRCPFARNGHESVVAGLRAGRDWDVTFLPFSLDQVHVEDDAPAVWELDPEVRGTGVSALTWGIAVRDESCIYRRLVGFAVHELLHALNGDVTSMRRLWKHRGRSATTTGSQTCPRCSTRS